MSVALLVAGLLLHPLAAPETPPAARAAVVAVTVENMYSAADESKAPSSSRGAQASNPDRIRTAIEVRMDDMAE